MFSVSNRLRHLQGDIRVKHGIVGKNSIIVNWNAFALQVFDNLCLQLHCGVIRADGNWFHVLLFAHFPFSRLTQYSSLRRASEISLVWCTVESASDNRDKSRRISGRSTNK